MRKSGLKKNINRLVLALTLIAVMAGWFFLFLKPSPQKEQSPVLVEQMQLSALPEPLPPPVLPPVQEMILPSAPPLQPQESSRPHTYSGKPHIAIVIDDMGLDAKGSARALMLPASVTLSYLPYASNLQAQADKAHGAGHELLLHMPMEPVGNANPGPGALLTSLPPEEIQTRIQKYLDSFSGYDGVNNHMGSKFTANADDMKLVIDALQPRHLFFFDSRTASDTVGEKVARAAGLPTIGRDVFLDDVIIPDSLHTQLADVERIATRKGYAIAIGHPHATTLEALEQWIPKAEAKGFELVPVRDLVKME